MRKKINRERILLVGLVAIAFFGFVLWSIQQFQSEQDASATASAPKITSATSNKAFKISSPKINAAIKSPIKISGQFLLTDGKIGFRIKDGKNLILAQTTTPKTASFSVDIKYKKPTTSKGMIEIFQVSIKTASETNKISIPVVFTD